MDVMAPPGSAAARVDAGPPGGRPGGGPAGRRSPEPAIGRYAVLGLGNRLQADEALGGLVVERFRTDGALLGGLPDALSVELLDGGTIGLGLLPYVAGLDGLVVVDIIEAGRTPGSLVDLDGRDVLDRSAAISVHDLGASEILGALLFMDALPRRVRVVGIQPRSIELGLELSAEVAAGVPALVEAVRGHLDAWQAEDAAPA